MSARFIVATVFDGLASLPDASVDLVLSSPPFLALRSYLPADHPTKAREIGSEATPADFLDTLLDVVEACDRVLAPHGSLVFELGDTYSGSGGAGGDYADTGLRAGQPGFSGSMKMARVDAGQAHPIRNLNGKRQPGGTGWPLDKSMVGIPHLFHLSLAYGRNLLRPERVTDPWRIRNVVAWCRPNPPVGALGDKFRPATSYLTVATKSRKRYFDLDAVRTINNRDRLDEPSMQSPRDFANFENGNRRRPTGAPQNPAGAPPLDWWEIPTAPYKGSHYATWPPDLLVKPILSMCPLRVCTVCGEPSRRIVETAQEDTGRTTNGTKPRDRAESFAGATYEKRTVASVTTLGWTECDCPYPATDAKWRAGLVLDPFAGSGTTLMVATGHGRDAIGIDLDHRNVALARERVGMFLEVEELARV